MPEVGENPRVRDSHRYYVVGAGYKSAFDEQISSLRPELKLERIQREPILPLETRTFGYLYETLAKRDLTTSVSISCISVAETAAEKVLSLLRRSAYKWDGHQTKGDIDPVLVRHVYDVAQIATKAPEALEASTSIFQTLVLNDRAEFRRLYAERLMPLIYDAKSLSFEDAFSTFEAVAHRLLDVCAIPSEPNGTTTN